MISCYVREQQRYTFTDLCCRFQIGAEQLRPMIRRMKAAGILKTVAAIDSQKNMSELMEEDVLVTGSEGTEAYYVFVFVGIIVIEGRILKCYPKYLKPETKPVEEMRQVIHVLEKYNKKTQLVQEFTEEQTEKGFNLLSLMLTLLQDYHEYGLYSNTRDIIEYNGMGNILWHRTIDESYAIISRDRPFYTELRTARRVGNDRDYFRRLHACVLTELSKELDETDIPELFGIGTADLSEETRDDFGDAAYISYRLERELGTEFSTRKQFVLKMLYSYINRRGGLLNPDCFTLFGTNAFNLVWEDVCAEVLGNQLQKSIGSIRLPVNLRPGYDPKCKLIDLIEKPVWRGDGYAEEASDTLIPDLVTIRERGGDWCFSIFDAKYYLPEIGKGKLRGQPGIESVTKQYLYQLAYRRFAEDHGICLTENCFLMPAREPEVRDAGTVSLAMMDALGLTPIRVYMLPASKMYSLYIAGHKTELSEL